MGFQQLSENRCESRNGKYVLDFRDDVVCSCRLVKRISEVLYTLGLITGNRHPSKPINPVSISNEFKTKTRLIDLSVHDTEFFADCQSSLI